MTYKPEWYMTLDRDEKLGRDGNYHTTTIGCGCCEGYETLTPEEYKKLVEDCIQYLKNLLKKIK